MSDLERGFIKVNMSKQFFKIKINLKKAFEEVALLKKSKASKQTLTDFLNELKR